MSHPLLRDTAHRGWPLPSAPWVMTQTWNGLMFAHWPIPPAQMAALLPPTLTLDTFDGQAWVGVVPFRITGIRPRWMPPVPGFTGFLELNVRTYVIRDGKPGVWFFSLDAASRLGVEGARLAYHLPYLNARMSMTRTGDTIEYASTRTDRRAGPGVFEASYGPTGDVYRSQPGTLDQFLTERYCLYSQARGRIYRANIQHEPWPLQPATADIRINTVSEAFGITLPSVPPLLHYVETIPVLAWYLEGAG